MTRLYRSIRNLLRALTCTGLLLASPHAVADGQREVDLQLIVAVDSSGSMSRSQARTQRQGFAAAFREPAIWDAVRSGPLARIAITYFEWSDEDTQTVIIPWRLTDDAEDLADIADELAAAEIPAPGGNTSISGAILFAHRMIAGSGFRSRRKVIDVSGDGPNNAGPPIIESNEHTRAAGITVNGLVMHGVSEYDAGPYWSIFPHEQGDTVDFFQREVRFGPGSFVMEVEDEADFAKAILRKLVLEIAWLNQ